MAYCENHNIYTDEQCSKCVIEDREIKLDHAIESFNQLALKHIKIEAENKIMLEALDRISEFKCTFFEKERPSVEADIANEALRAVYFQA